MRTALQRASRAMASSPTPVRANKAPMTRAVSGVNCQGQVLIMKPGCKKRNMLVSKVKAPTMPITRRTRRGTRRSWDRGPGSVARLRSQSRKTMNGVVKYSPTQAKKEIEPGAQQQALPLEEHPEFEQGGPRGANAVALLFPAAVPTGWRLPGPACRPRGWPPGASGPPDIYAPISRPD